MIERNKGKYICMSRCVSYQVAIYGLVSEVSLPRYRARVNTFRKTSARIPKLVSEDAFLACAIK
jgi:hypothetical protein